MFEKYYSNSPSSLKTNVIYAMTEFATNPISTLLMAYLVYFYTDIVGLNPAIVGTVLLVSKFMDGFSDLIAGNIIDHTHTKYGTARPWYLRLAIPVVFSYIILFTVPNCGMAGKIAYVFISYNLSSTVVYTLFNAAAASYPVFLTKNRESRSIMHTMRLFVACSTQIFLMMFGLRFVDMLGGGQGGWIKLAAILGGISALVMVFIFLNTKEQVTENEEDKTNVSLVTALKVLLQNKYWFILLLAFFLGVIIQVCTLTDGVYYAKYVMNDLNMQANLTMYFLVPNLIPMLVLPTCFKKGISKRNLCILGAVLLLIGTIIGVVIPTGIGFVIGLALRGVGYGLNACCQSAMVVETIVYGEWKTGYNIPGVTMTATCAAQKLGSGIGAALLGVVLGAFGYNGLSAVQPQEAVNAINYIYMIVPAVLAVGWLLLFKFYGLEEEYPQYVKELEARHGRQAEE